MKTDDSQFIPETNAAKMFECPARVESLNRRKFLQGALAVGGVLSCKPATLEAVSSSPLSSGGIGAPLSAGAPVHPPVESLPTMPLPHAVSPGTGELAIGRNFRFHVEGDPDDQLLWSAVNRTLQSVKKITGLPLAQEVATAASTSAPGIFSIRVHKPATMVMGTDESYSLVVSSASAVLSAPTTLGAVRGLATFRQLIQKSNGNFHLPVVSIEDAPRYPWRGLMIDVARHFIPIDSLKRNIDAMELVKLNVLHLHLSDNEGFRVESKVYPKLQLKGSLGQYFTQEEIRQLVEYAGLRGILVVPEFDMPSHSISWLAAYPELSSSPGPFQPGFPPHVPMKPGEPQARILAEMQTLKIPAIDPTRETTYTFIDGLVGEMSKLFPGHYFHIGADENNGAIWRANPKIVAFMKAHDLPDTQALQTYFVARVQAIVKKHGKQAVAWEDAYAPGQTRDLILQVWSPFAKQDLTKVPMKNGNKILVSRGFYLDTFFPAHVCYSGNALPPQSGYGKDEAVLGGEAAMWAELEDRWNMEARIWPRAGAVAERFWSPADVQNVEDMYRRLFRLSFMLDQAGVNNLVDYERQIRRFAGPLPAGPVKTLLDVLTPTRGYRRLFGLMQRPATERNSLAPLNTVADAVLADSAPKYEFRWALAAYLKTHSAASERKLRSMLTLWARNDERLAPYFAQSKDLQEVSEQSKNLSNLAQAGLQFLDLSRRGKTPGADQRAGYEAAVKAAKTSHGGTDIAVAPEIEALFEGKLNPEPTTYPLF
ncbi:MAG: family 20 glycosylhydrolase [Acidobacteriota bacterium]